jgi:tripartite-type tricarboxylate transporter receptor subunit TctC
MPDDAQSIRLWYRPSLRKVPFGSGARNHVALRGAVAQGRLDVLPDTPTVADFVPGYEASGFAGIGAPKNTPADIIELLNKELNAGLADSRVKGRIMELGGTVLGGSAAEFGTILSEAIEKWTRVIKFAGIKAE